MPQISSEKWVEQWEDAKLLTRSREEKRVDELPRNMEDHPDPARYVERVKECAFPLLENAYGARATYARALGCDYQKVGVGIAAGYDLHHEPQRVKTAP